MLTPAHLHQYQQVAYQHQLQNPFSMLWLGMGLGKTITTLTTIEERMDRCEVYGVLIIAPVRVCQTVWEQEARKWAHTKHLKFSPIYGPDRSRRRWNLARRADVYLLNYENLPWLVSVMESEYLGRGRVMPFNMVVYDEVSKLKTKMTARHTALRKILPWLPYRTGLTGTPASNGYKDLFGQYLALDSGARLGTSVTAFKQTLYMEEHNPFKETRFGDGTPCEKAYPIIHAAIADITLQMDSRDYLDMPDCVYNQIWVEMPAEAMERYQQLETEMFMELDSGNVIEVFNAGAKTGKCLQAANGAVYIEPGQPDWDYLHDAKLDALEDIVEEAGGDPILLLYQYKHDRERIRKRFPDVREFKSGMSTEATLALVADWNAGRVPILMGHPASMGHGLNLAQGGCTVVWFGLNWSLELYEQANARVDRQGQQRPVRIHQILTQGTMDHAQLIAINSKASTQAGLMEAVSAYREQKQGPTPAEVIRESAVADALRIVGGG